MTGLRALARAWAAEDPDAADREEIERLLADTAPGAGADLADRFSGRLRFGTAGLRGAVGAGPNRMNRATVRMATAALARWLAGRHPARLGNGVVVSCDARHRSTALADETTAVLAGAGIPVHRLEDRQPTPLLAFAVRHLRAAAGVMITASHNPAADNGYKLYLGDGAQIVPPVDAEIEALMERIGPLGSVPLGDTRGPLVRRHGNEVADAYVAAVVTATAPGSQRVPPLSVVYTPMHGVAGALFLDAMRRAGHPPPAVVAAQAEPDPEFPTVAFPNPEAPGALDLALDEARRTGADLVLASDPDGDRLAVAVPDHGAGGGWRRLSGDELGVLLGDFVLERTPEGTRPPAPAVSRAATPVVAASIVSSSMLERVAAQSGAVFVATLTGFKWIVRATDAVAGGRFVFGYEEALGYAIGDVVRDKDGIGAGLAVLALAGELRAGGRSLLDRLDDLYRRHGVHLTAQHTVPTHNAAAKMAQLRADPPATIGTVPVVRTVDLEPGCVWQEGFPALPPSDVLGFWLASGARLLVRPSGTEPKLKCYLQVVHGVVGGDVGRSRHEAASELAALVEAAAQLVA